MDVQLDTAVEAIERRGDELVVRLRTKGETHQVEADLVVHAAGRVPEIDDLDLGRAGVAFAKEGVTVNEYLQSVTNPDVYAAGDAVDSGGFRLTPVAGMQGRIVASNLLKGNHDTPDYSGIPSVVFTTPTLSKVGLDEVGARELGLRFRVNRGDTSGWYTSRRVALEHTGFKVLIEEETDRVLGAHLLGGHSEGHQYFRAGDPGRPACGRPETDGVCVPDGRLRHRLHGLVDMGRAANSETK